MQAVYRRLVIRPVEVICKTLHSLKESYAKAFAAAARLEDEGAAAKALPRRSGEQLPAGNKNSVGGANAGGLEGGVLAWLADLEIERPAAVDDTTPVPLQPSQHGSGQLGGVAMIPCVRGGAHPVVEDTLGRRPRQIEDAAVEEPFAPRQ